MPPMLPICMSTMTRSGDSSATSATTSGPERRLDALVDVGLR